MASESVNITVFVGILLSLTPWPFLPLIFGGGRRDPFRKVRLILGLLWLAWIAVILAISFYNPQLLYGLAVLVGFSVILLFWVGRDNYGQSQNIPKGSLSLSQSLLAIVDRNYYLKAAARYGPIFKMSQFHKPTICVIGFEQGHRLLREHRNSFGSCSQPFNSSIAGGFLRYMDNKTHARYAGLFSKALALPVLNDAVSTMQSACLMTMSNMANACKTSGSLGVSPRTFCEQFSYDASVRVLFGINPGTELYDELKSTFKMLNALDVSKKINKDMEKVLDRLRHFVQDHFKSLNSDPDSSVTCTLTELHRLDPSMPDAVCVDNLLFILKIASENVASLLLWLFKMLGENPEWMRRITEAEGGDGQGSQGAVIDRVVNETLRLAQSEYLYRRLLDDVQFDGMRLPKGWQLRLCVWESHRSAESFKHPNDFNPDRFLQRKIGVSEFSPFGYGAHGCNGVAMTSMICRVLLECLAGKFDWSVTEDGRIERKFLHWHHWQPSSSMRVQIEARNGQQ